MTLVVDASVAAKWVLPEPGSSQATALRRSDPNLIAPALVVAEIGNALWKAASRGDFDAADATGALRAAEAHFTRLVATNDLAIEALRLAIELQHPIYDCFYLALALQEQVPIVSVDKRFLALGNRIRTVEFQAL